MSSVATMRSTNELLSAIPATTAGAAIAALHQRRERFEHQSTFGFLGIVTRTAIAGQQWSDLISVIDRIFGSKDRRVQ